MDKPNPASIFGRRQSPRTPESPATPSAAYEQRGSNTREIAKDDEVAKARRTDHQLGNPELPIADYREQIVDAVDCSQAVVITAETGAGKSTQVPQFLAEQGYEVVVTQPRVVAARNVAEHVREEVVAKYGDDFKEFVGYRTARERGDSAANQILFATDGLQLVRELSGHGVGKKQALVLDEVHEWNENMEVLVAWAKQRMNEDSDFKVVVMSATMEAGPLAKYFAEDKREVPVIEVPGRTFEVEKSEGGDVAVEAIKMAQAGKNTLVFVPGKAEIDQVMAEIGRANIPGATVLPLHGQLEVAEQRKVFAKYPGVKIIVATNVAQTSVTIEDIDAVVDSGLERTNEVRNGVEGLYLKPISQADCLQRAGRAGRTKEGEYVLARLGNSPFAGMKDREPYGTPEILRTRLDGMVLRLAKNGFDAATMDFYHSKDEHGRDIRPEIAAAKLRLQKLGALREDDSITKIGRDMERMSVESHYARMMIEARKYGPEVQMQLAAMLAVQEADGIVQFGTRNKPSEERWRSLLQPGMNDSDMIKQLEVFIAARSMSDREKRDNDIFVKAFGKANEVLRQLRGVEKLHDQELAVPTPEQREQLIKCIISGMVDNLYINDGYYGHRDAHGSVREVSSRSIIRPDKMVIGKSFDLQVNTRRGMTTLSLLESLTNVPSVELLRDVAPQLFSEKSAGLTLDNNGVAYQYYYETFNGVSVGERQRRLAEPSSERRDYLLDNAVRHYYGTPEMMEIAAILSDLQQRSGEQIALPYQNEVVAVVREFVPITVATVEDAMQYVPHIELDDIVSPGFRAEIEQNFPFSYYGLELTYPHQRPMADVSGMSDEQIARLPDEAAILPNGTYIYIEGGYGYYSGPALLQQTIQEKRALLAANAEAQMRESAEAQGWLVDYGGAARERSGSRNQGWYVITPGGEMRKGDDGSRWSYVRPDEVAISYEHGTRDPNSGAWAVDQLPSGITPAQIEAVRGLEQELGMHVGAWNVEPTLSEYKKSVVAKVVRAVPLMGQIDAACRETDYVYSRLMSQEGLGVPMDERQLTQKYGRQWQSYDFDERVDGREACLLEEIAIGDGQYVKVLAYYKYGYWNVALQMVEYDEAEAVDDTPSHESVDEVTTDMLSALQQKKW